MNSPQSRAFSGHAFINRSASAACSSAFCATARYSAVYCLAKPLKVQVNDDLSKNKFNVMILKRIYLL